LQMLQLLPLITTNATDLQVIGNFRLEKEFFDFAASEAKTIIDYEVLHSPFKPFNEPHYYSRWINVTKFVQPRFNLTIDDGGVRFRSTGGYVKVAAGMVVKLLITKTGKVIVKCSGIRTDVKATIETRDGRPQIAVRHCDISIKTITVNTHMGATLGASTGFSYWFQYRYLPSEFRKYCDKLRDIVNQTNQFIANLPAHIPVWENVTFNYRLLADPQFRQGAIDVTSAFGVSSSNVDYYYEEENNDEFTEIDFGESHGAFSTLFGDFHVLDLLFYPFAIIGLVGLIVGKKEGKNGGKEQ
ncbi:hypothetical protein PENTCL1PPCAC_3320, partial [Pristionchus entomophagus]